MPRILVVDDEKLIADSLVRILAASGYEAFAVYSGEEAVEAAMRLKPDVVLTDVVMGLISGIVAAVLIRRSLPECRVILLSGNPQTSLMMDDAAADTLVAILCLRGYDAFELASAEEALPWCCTHKPDVVIADLTLGAMSGVQLATRLANSLPQCKVLLISGRALTSRPQRDSQSSDYQFAFMAKPVHPREIIAFLDSF